MAVGCGKGDSSKSDEDQPPDRLVAKSIGAVYALDGRHPAALVAHGGGLFWVEKNRVMAGTVKGGEPRVLAPYRGFAARAQIAADDSRVYWIDGGAIFRTSSTAGTPKRISTRHAAVALTVFGDHIYYVAVERGDGGSQHVLWRFDKSAEHGRAAAKLGARISIDRGAPRIAIRGERLFCACGSALTEGPLDGGAARTLVSGGRYVGVAVADDAVYYIDSAGQHIGRAPRVSSDKALVIRRGAFAGIALAGRAVLVSERERVTKISP